MTTHNQTTRNQGNKGIQQKIDPSTESNYPATENNYWKTQYENESYYEAGRKFDDYEGAYRTGYEGYDRYGDQGFDQVENQLKSDYERTKGNSQLAWNKAKNAVKAAWHRAERAMPGDFDNDGR